MITVKRYFTNGPAGRTPVEESFADNGAEFSVSVGDVIRLGGKLRLFVLVNDCRASHIALAVQKTTVVFRRGFPDERTAEVNQRSVAEDCSTTLPRDMLVKRLGEDAVKQFHAAKKDGSVDAWILTNLGAPAANNQQTENDTDMKKAILPRRGGLAASVLADKAAASAKTPATPKTKKATNKPKKTATEGAATGRAKFVGDLVAAGKTDAEIVTATAEKFAGSSESLVKRIIKRKRK